MALEVSTLAGAFAEVHEHNYPSTPFSWVDFIDLAEVALDAMADCTNADHVGREIAAEDGIVYTPESIHFEMAELAIAMHTRTSN